MGKFGTVVPGYVSASEYVTMRSKLLSRYFKFASTGAYLGCSMDTMTSKALLFCWFAARSDGPVECDGAW